MRRPISRRTTISAVATAAGSVSSLRQLPVPTAVKMLALSSPSSVLAILLAGIAIAMSMSCGSEGTAESTRPSQAESTASNRPQGTEVTAPRFNKVDVDWDEVKDLVSFEVLRPTSIPDEARLLHLTLHFMSKSPEFPLGRDGIILAFYRVGEDGFLSIEQGWGIAPPPEQLLGQAASHGMEQVAGYEVTWIIGRKPGGVGPPNSTKPDESHIRVGWKPDPKGSTGPGWELTTDSLSRQQLFSIVEGLTTP